MMRSFSRRTRCATASTRGSAAAAPASRADERLAPALDPRDRERLPAPPLLLRVVLLVPVERLLLERLLVERLLVDWLASLGSDEPVDPDSELEPLFLACGMLPSQVMIVLRWTLLVKAIARQG
jgi:hypothetical protein